MKKRFLYSVLPLLLLLTFSGGVVEAQAMEGPIESPCRSVDTGMAVPVDEFGSPEWFTAMQEMCRRHAGDPCGSYHTQLSFFSSYGCDDICCTNPSHFHWCPSTCEYPEHFHSEAEYRSAGAAQAPPCPCHSTPAYPLLPEEEDVYWQTVREAWLSGASRALPFAG